MECKTCAETIKLTDKFCSNCGCKVVTDRLSLKGTWNEFIGPFFNWENYFWRTTHDMFLKPQYVLAAYISGARKKYFQPFSYLILFATVALIFYKFFPLSELTDFASKFDPTINNANGTQPPNPFGDQRAINEFIFNYYNIFLILTIPIIAWVTYIVFRKRGNNFAEHLVFQAYIQSILGYLTIILQMIIILFMKLDYSIYLWSYFIAAVGYSSYVFTKFYKLTFRSILLANAKFMLFGLLVFLVILIFMAIIMALYLIVIK